MNAEAFHNATPDLIEGVLERLEQNMGTTVVQERFVGSGSMAPHRLLQAQLLTRKEAGETSHSSLCTGSGPPYSY